MTREEAKAILANIPAHPTSSERALIQQAIQVMGAIRGPT